MGIRLEAEKFSDLDPIILGDHVGAVGEFPKKGEAVHLLWLVVDLNLGLGRHTRVQPIEKGLASMTCKMIHSRLLSGSQT